MCRWHHPMTESKEELRSLLMKVKEESEKDHGIWSTTSWQIDGETKETVTDLIFLGSKITVDGDCSHEIKRRLLLGRKAMTKLDGILKSRDITLLTKFCIDKAMIFPVVMYRCESWTIKKLTAKNWCFQTVVLEKTLESPYNCKEIKPVDPKGNQSWIVNWKDWC